MKRISVIANCHCLPIARLLALMTRDCAIEFIDLNFLDHEPHKTRVSQLQEPAEDKLVFSFEISDDWPGVSTTSLRRLYGDKLTTFTNIFFSGLHPDITYIGQMGSRIQGPMSDYHSKLAIYCYASGRSLHDTQTIFERGNVFQDLGYFGDYHVSATELASRDKTKDVGFALDMQTIIPQEYSLFTVNHPTVALLKPLATKICRHANLDVIDIPDVYFDNTLCQNVIWPVYDQIAEYHRLNYRTPMVYIRRDDYVSRGLTLHEFLTASFQAYAQIAPSSFAAGARQLHFFSAFDQALG